MNKKFISSLLLFAALLSYAPVAQSAAVNCPAGFASLNQADFFKTARLVMAPIADEDKAKAVAIYMDPAVQKMSGDVYDEGTFYGVLGSGQPQVPKDGNRLRVLNMGVKDKDGKFLGITQLGGGTHPGQHSRKPEIANLNGNFGTTGYHFDKSTWGKGIATEATSRLYAYGFDELKLDGIFAEVLPTNIGSAKVLEKQGFVRVANEGEIDHYNHYFLSKEKYLENKTAANAKPDPTKAGVTKAVVEPVQAAVASDSPEVLNTARFRLSPIKEADYDKAVAIYMEPEVQKMSGDVYGAGTFRNIVASGKKKIPQKGEGVRIVNLGIKDQNDDFLGIVQLGDGIWPGAHTADPALVNKAGNFGITGYHLKQAAWGKGVATEATSKVYAHAFDELNMDGIFAEVIPTNVGSARVLEKQGFVKVADKGEIDNNYHYFLSKEKYLEKKATAINSPKTDPGKAIKAVPDPASPAVRASAANPFSNAYAPEVKAAVANASPQNPVHIRLSILDTDMADEMDDAFHRLKLNPERTKKGTTDEVLITVSEPYQARALDTFFDVYKDILAKSELAKDVVKRAPALPRSMTPKVVEALGKASKERPVMLDLGVHAYAGADDMDNALRAIGARVQGYDYPMEGVPNSGSRTVTLTSQDQAKKLKDLMMKYEKVIRAASVRTEPLEVIVPKQLSAEASKAMEKASAENPVTLVLSIKPSNRTENIDYLLGAMGAKVEKTPDARIVTINDSLQEEKLRGILSGFDREIPMADVVASAAAVRGGGADRMSKAVSDALSSATKDKPVTLSISVSKHPRAAEMDEALRKISDEVTGQGFPLETIPGQGGRVVVIRNPEQGMKIKEWMNEYPQEVGTIEIQPANARPAPGASAEEQKAMERLAKLRNHMRDQGITARPKNMTEEVDKAIRAATPQNPVRVKLGVDKVDNAAEMDAALRGIGAHVEGQGFPFETIPAHGNRYIVITNAMEAKKLEEVMAKFQKAITDSNLSK